MPKLFISYRRNDTEHVVPHIHTNLSKKFESTFWDAKDIRAGEDFRRKITKTLHLVDTVLVIIGPQWLTSLNERLNRDGPDWVKYEIEQGLLLEKRVVPVLVMNAEMPSVDELPESLKPMAYLNAAKIRSSDFEEDMKKLIEGLDDSSSLETNKPLPSSNIKANTISDITTPRRYTLSEEQRKFAEAEAKQKEQYQLPQIPTNTFRVPTNSARKINPYNVIIAALITTLLIVAAFLLLFLFSIFYSPDTTPTVTISPSATTEVPILVTVNTIVPTETPMVTDTAIAILALSSETFTPKPSDTSEIVTNTATSTLTLTPTSTITREMPSKTPTLLPPSSIPTSIPSLTPESRPHAILVYGGVSVQVHELASNESPEIGEIKEGDIAIVLRLEDDWYLVELADGTQGWVLDSMIRVQNEGLLPPTSTPTPSACQVSPRNGVGSVALRDEPDIDSARISVLNEGEFLIVDGRTGANYQNGIWWTAIRLGNDIWISDALVDKSGNCDNISIIENP